MVSHHLSGGALHEEWKKFSSGKSKILKHSCKNTHTDSISIPLSCCNSLALRTHYNNLTGLDIEEQQQNKKIHIHSLVFSYTLKNIWRMHCLILFKQLKHIEGRCQHPLTYTSKCSPQSVVAGKGFHGALAENPVQRLIKTRVFNTQEPEFLTHGNTDLYI